MPGSRNPGPMCQVHKPVWVDDGTMAQSIGNQQPAIGMIPRLPKASLAQSWTKYRVRPGDTLWDIARLQCNDPFRWTEIARLNGLTNPDLLLVGITLKLPIVNPTETPAARVKPTGQIVGPPAAKPPDPPASKPDLAKKPARPSDYPPYNYELEKQPLVTVTVPGAEMKLSLIGSIKLKHKGAPEVLTITKEGIDLEYKQPADKKYKQLTLDSKLSYNWEKKTVEFSCGLTSAVEVDGKVWSTSSVNLLSDGFEYTVKPKEVTGESGDWEITGEMGYEVSVKFKPPKLAPFPVPSSEQIAQVTKWVAVAGIVGLAGVIIVGDTAKDVASLGAGSVESPLSYAAAAALIRQAQLLLAQ